MTEDVGRSDDLTAGPSVAGEPDDEVEPVELLVQLAEEGEIEPWDIDIVDVTDKFLARLDATDLRTSGRALFYASVLLRMKSDELLGGNEDDGEDEDDIAWDDPFEGDGDPIAGLEQEMDRRLERKGARGKPETLDELVRELRDRERRRAWWKEAREYDTSGSPRGFSRGTQTLDYRSGDEFRADDEPTEGDITGRTHTEDIETVIEDVAAELTERYAAGREEVLYVEIRDSGGSAVETYLALLFLAHRGEVRLEQDDLFGDLWIEDRGIEDALGADTERDVAPTAE